MTSYPDTNTVSLEKGMDAIGKSMGWDNMVTDANAKGVAIAVADAWGLPYAD